MSKLIVIRCLTAQLRNSPGGIAGADGRLYHPDPTTGKLYSTPDLTGEPGVPEVCADRFLRLPGAFEVELPPPPPPPRKRPAEPPKDDASPRTARLVELKALDSKALRALATAAGLKPGRLSNAKVVDLVLAAEYPEP